MYTVIHHAHTYVCTTTATLLDSCTTSCGHFCLTHTSCEADSAFCSCTQAISEERASLLLSASLWAEEVLASDSRHFCSSWAIVEDCRREGQRVGQIREGQRVGQIREGQRGAAHHSSTNHVNSQASTMQQQNEGQGVALLF